MGFPNLRGKHAKDSMINPNEFMEYLKNNGKYPKFDTPEGVVLCYSRSFLKYVIDTNNVTKVEGFAGDMYLINEAKGKIAIIGNFGIGAPVVVSLVEELIAFGVKRFISIGAAGTLQKNIKIGDLMVCDRAIRDEGTSHHYIKSSKYAHASKEMTQKIKEVLDKYKRKYFVGTSWTIDAPYRETVAEAKKYQKQGVATVEMEASALFAVAKYRNVEMGAIFTISDSLAELEWQPKFHYKKKDLGMEKIYKVAIDVLMD